MFFLGCIDNYLMQIMEQANAINPLKCDHFSEKSEKGSISKLSTKVQACATEGATSLSARSRLDEPRNSPARGCLERNSTRSSCWCT